MKFTNRPYLKLLRLKGRTGVYEHTDLARFQVVNLCDFWGIDFTMIEKAVENPNPATEVYIDLPVYYASKKENKVNSDKNIGEEIRLVVPSAPRIQSLLVTKDNIIMAAQWCGSSVIYVPSGPDRWSFDNGKERVNVGDFLVRERDGKFVAMRPYDFHEKYDEV